MTKTQVVVIEGEYGTDTYYDKESIDLIYIDLTPFNDSYPDKYELRIIKADILKKLRPQDIQ